jgi:hypothetical protein
VRNRIGRRLHDGRDGSRSEPVRVLLAGQQGASISLLTPDEDEADHADGQHR